MRMVWMRNRYQMKRLIAKSLEHQIRTRLRTVLISSVRCEKRPAGIREGWGGESIESFPPYGFFRMFDAGEKEKAVRDMENWYYERMITAKLILMPKCDGGMAGGSLFREISRVHDAKDIALRADLSNADDCLVRQAITRRVQQRFSLLESIKQQGQCFMWDYVRMIPNGDSFTLVDGHHRVAAIAVCGQSSVLAAVPDSAFLRFLRRIAMRLFPK